MGTEQSEIHFPHRTQGGLLGYHLILFLTNVLQHHRHAFYRGLVERDDIVEPDFDDDACSRYYACCVSY